MEKKRASCFLPFFIEFVKFSIVFAVLIAGALITLRVAVAMQ